MFASSFIAGALLNQLTQLLNDPSTVLAVIGAGAPQTATFFINYILTNVIKSAPYMAARCISSNAH